jgi:hypothetical protein
MQNIQLYIEGNRMDMFKDESVSLTQTIQNVKDIAKVFTNFTKTFSLPASKDNNKVFEHYYNYNIDDGFDARVKKTATIELNYFPFEKGKIKLEGVDMKDNKPYAYRVTFFGDTVDLKDLLGEDKLDALTWLNNFTTNYNAAQVQGALRNGKDFTVDSVTYTDALVVPLITHTDRLYYNSASTGDGNLHPNGTTQQGVLWNQLKFAIRVDLIVKAIEEQYGITFSNDFFTSSNTPYYNLYMWMHRKKGFIDDPNAPETYDHIVDFGLPDTSSWNHLTISGENIIVSGLTGAHKITATFTVDPDASESSDYTVQLLQGGTVVETFSGTAPSDVAVSADLGNGTYNLKMIISETFTVTDVEFDAADLLQPISDTFNSGSFTINATKTFSGTAQMPNMKVIDFLTGLFKVFNLTAYKQDNGTIKVQKLDSFYSGGSTFTIDEYVDMSQRQIDVALPYKEIDFGYKGLGTKLAIQHSQLTQGTEWGKAEYRGGDAETDQMAGGIYKVEAPFEHMKFERLLDAGSSLAQTDAQVGWFVDDNDDPYLGEALLFYPIRISSGTSIRFLNDESTDYTDITDYYIPSNSVSTSASTDDDNIHFNQELNEYTPTETFAGTLFANYYTSYITDVFKVKRRLFKVKAYLPLKILRTYTLADKFVIGNQEYRINSITTNLGTGESDLELLNIV